jgi:hypothetical protein
MGTVGRIFRSGVLAADERRRSRRETWSILAARVNRRFDGFEIDVADEIDWMSKSLGWEYSVTFVGDDQVKALNDVAAAYQALAARLAVRAVLSGGEQPIVKAEAQVALATAKRLARHAQRDAAAINSAGRIDPVSTAERHVTWTAPAGPADRRTDIDFFSLDPGTGYEAHGLLVSWRRRRVVLDHPDAIGRARAEGVQPIVVTTAAFETTLAEVAGQAHGYDGTLPALVAHRSEKDNLTGQRRLHLSLVEISYSAHRVISAPRFSDDSLPRTLTLSMMPITADGFLVLARRSAGNSYYANSWGPGVNGNLNMPVRQTGYGDADEDGLPDLLAALGREAIEELGMTVDQRHIHVHGLARIANAKEVGTWILLTTGRIPMTLDELRSQTRFALPLEGRWEVGSQLLAVPLPRTESAGQEALAWAWSNDDVMPHAAAVLAGYCSAEGASMETPRSWNRGHGVPLPAGSIVVRYG